MDRIPTTTRPAHCTTERPAHSTTEQSTQFQPPDGLRNPQQSTLYRTTSVNTIRLSHRYSHWHSQATTDCRSVTVSCSPAPPARSRPDLLWQSVRPPTTVQICLSVCPIYLRTYEHTQVRSGDTPVHCVQYTNDMWYCTVPTAERALLHSCSCAGTASHLNRLLTCIICRQQNQLTIRHTQHTIILYRYKQLHVSANQIATIALYM